MNLTARNYLILFFCLIAQISFAAGPANDECSSATAISTGTNTGNMWNATATSSPANSCGSYADVWYSFTVPSNASSTSISLSSTNPSQLDNTNTYFQVYRGSDCSAVAVGSCTTFGTTLTSALTPGSYLLRVSSTATLGGNSSNKWDFTISLSFTTPPSNDDCSGATSLTIGTTNTSGTVWNATASTGITAGCATGNPDDDVWYKFTATSSNASIALSSVGSDLSASGTMMQLFSGNCASLTSIACAGTSTLYTNSLTSGQTYYIRVYSYGTGALSTSSGSTFSITVTVPSTPSSTSGSAGRMKEIFQQTIINPNSTALNDPWEVIYGPDGYLWITEAKGYKAYRMDPSNGAKVTILDISQNSTFLPLTDTSYDVEFSSTFSPWPQGGFAGMALHPKFMDPVTPVNYVYISYVHKWISGTASSTTAVYFTNRLVRFTYNTSTGKLGNPVSICDTLPGSSDHNSQRMIIAPVNGTYYLFYAQGDMGAGQFTNLTRTEKAQIAASYEGKILRFNLDTAGGQSWIPSDNPSSTSAVWASGIRNNQGFGYARINNTDYIYGSSHGPYSDDEINIIQKGKNYGHPLVIGYASDENYKNAAAGPSNGSLPVITSEVANAAAIGSSYQDPIESFYPAPQATIYNIWTTNPANSTWPSEAPSGMEVYTNSVIPGWKNSILQSMLKGGKIMRLKLNSNGNGISQTEGYDTVSYFYSVNRFRDVAIAPDGKTIYAIIDKSSTTSGPTTTNPMVSACAGCVIKYTFLGYATTNGKSDIPTSVDVSTGTTNSVMAANTITIDASNNNLWVPITGTDGNIIAEIKANGNNLGTVTTSYYINSGAVRENSSRRLYADRNITITPQVQPSSSVSIRLYLTAAEFNALKSATNSFGNSSGVSTIADLSILKNSDACSAAMSSATTTITPQYAEAFGSNYVLQGSISSFSSFYFGNPSMAVLPVQLVNFWGSIQNNTAQLQWETANEANTSHFEVERSVDGTSFVQIGKVNAAGNSIRTISYGYPDADIYMLSVPTLYYRLKIVDQDGKFTYSKTISFPLTKSQNIVVYPNPVKQTLSIRINGNDLTPVVVEVTDLNGRVVYSQRKQATEAINIDVHSWKPQVYMLRVINSRMETIAVQKFEKL